MGNKAILFSLLTGSVFAALIVVVGLVAFTQLVPVQAEEATLEVAPSEQIAPVSHQVEKPVMSYDRVKYAGKSGNCSYESATHLMVEAPAQQVDDPLLSLADTN